MICLKRFSNHLRKNNKLITFPLTDLNMSKYVVGYNSNSYVYDLYGICNHTGNVMGGHYFAYIKTKDDMWYEFNDTEVAKTEKNFYDSAYIDANYLPSPTERLKIYKKIQNTKDNEELIDAVY